MIKYIPIEQDIIPAVRLIIRYTLKIGCIRLQALLGNLQRQRIESKNSDSVVQLSLNKPVYKLRHRVSTRPTYGASIYALS